ncbi:MAG: type II toxin-antitoxin system RelE/ParE family toxin [Methylococcales bacterium]
MTYLIHTTAIFDKWLSKIKDKATRYRLETRLSRIANGHFGDAKPIESNLFELRFFFCSGFRIYYTIRGAEIVLLLCGGDKSSQSSDIETAKKLLNELNNED